MNIDRITLLGIIISVLGCIASITVKNFLAATLWLLVAFQDYRIVKLEEEITALKGKE